MELEERQAMKPSDEDHPYNSNTKSKKPEKFKKWDYFSEYCGSTTIHGVSYLGEPRRPILERIWWIIVFIISITFLVILIRKTWMKWDDSPVIVSFNDKLTPLWQIPFPAVTICPESKFRQELFNMTEVLLKQEKTTQRENETLLALSQVCSREMVDLLTLNETFGSDAGMDSAKVSLLDELAVPLDELFFSCSIAHMEEDCSEAFSKILTEEGICYTFNILSQPDLLRENDLQKEYRYIHSNKSTNDWTLQDGYAEHSPFDSYPLRAIGAGADFRVQVYLRGNPNDLDYMCSFGSKGYKVLLHQPAEYPRISQQYFHVPLDQDVVVSVKPNMMTISDGLRSYDPKSRQCYYPNEKKLRFYKTYTQSNCEQECLANFTQLMCNCVPFSLPRDKSTPICGLKHQKCKHFTQVLILLHNCPTDLKKTIPEYTEALEDVLPHCDCLPGCKSIQYDADVSQSSFDLNKVLGPLVKNWDRKSHTISRLSIHFHADHILTTHRSEFTGYTDFLANVGGLLGLFMGVSILSIIEIIYFLSLRLFYTLRAHFRGDNKKE